MQVNVQGTQIPGELFPDGVDDFEFPPFLRRAERGTRLATENMIQAINSKIAKLAELGLRPHPNLLEYRHELMAQLEKNGPYQVRVSSGVF